MDGCWTFTGPVPIIKVPQPCRGSMRRARNKLVSYSMSPNAKIIPCGKVMSWYMKSDIGWDCTIPLKMVVPNALAESMIHPWNEDPSVDVGDLQPNPVHNFMDFSSDLCQYVFTLDQAFVMQVAYNYYCLGNKIWYHCTTRRCQFGIDHHDSGTTSIVYLCWEKWCGMCLGCWWRCHSVVLSLEQTASFQ